MMTQLAPHHYAELHEGSGISDEVIESRGAFSVTFPAELRDLGFPEWQARLAPGYVLPLHTLNGFPQTYVFKPDKPRKEVKESGKVRLVKYEYPAGAQVRLDVPPCCKNLVLDPEIPLMFVEGWKKGDKGATEGLAIVVVGGVWNFLSGGVPLPDFEDIPLEGRKVAICFDSDVARNESVRMARERFAQVLAERGARVYFITLPDAADGSKQGLDDYLLHKPAWAVWALAEAAAPAADSESGQVRAQLREVQRLQSATARLATNPDARKYAHVGIRLANELARVKASEQPTEHGDYRISHARLRQVEYTQDGLPDRTKKVVCSENTVRQRLQELPDIISGLKISKRPGLVTVRQNGVEREVYSDLTYVDWSGTPSDLLEALADIHSDKPEARGGKRCPGCGSKKIRTRYECTDCGEVFHTPVEGDLPTEQPTAVSEAQALQGVYDRAQPPPANFAGEEPGLILASSPIPLVALSEGEVPSVANFATDSAAIPCTFSPYGCQCPHPDRCLEQGRCSP